MAEEQEQPLIASGDPVIVLEGEYKGKTATVIAPYTNSISIELDDRDEDGTKPRTVLRHSEYELLEKSE
ncbi:DUF2187 domain-containing protein [Paenalkalicoccus suaedae]|uniref:DUF2187 domain-containing protein n=1 Tax=Paenalkalicoccus suaedae TaxID=2592382 RepID=A0A859FGC1_9BACI|nr:DUF2187 domain-containing protein [Paenalkalicoccus suaedae]QKS71276.1 DUF2187 domain-containing protein [Paenalkalicoccus suaedae]